MGWLNPTKAQLGAGTDPTVHAEGVDPATLRIGGEGWPAEPGPGPAPSSRSFRSRQWTYPAPGPATTGAAGDPTQLDGPGGHDDLTGVDPDGRRMFNAPRPAGFPGAVAEALDPIPQQVYSHPNMPVTIDNQAPPERTRGGGVGADNTRASVVSRWLFQRPFDQGIAQHLTGNKSLNLPPQASRPIHYADPVAAGLPNSPGGTQAAPGMHAVGIQPNTQRLLPRPWDELLATTGAGTAPAQQQDLSARGRAWRLG